MSYVPGRDRIAAQVDVMLEVLEERHPGAIAALRTDALAELARWDDVDVDIVDGVPFADDCQVAGSYERRGDVDHLTIAAANSRGREQFSVLHELGHALQRHHRRLTRSLAQEPGGGRELEERACDEFAARLLLPDDLLTSHIPDKGPTAADVVELMRVAAASRQACCIAASRRLRAPGHVLLLDDTGTLLFPASVGLPRPPRDSDQSGCSLVARALDGHRSARVTDAQLRYKGGDWLGDELFGDAAWHGSYLVAVLTTDHLPWGGLAVRTTSPAATRSAGPTASWWTCEQCGEGFPTHNRCERCHDPRCPSCGHCTCANKVTTTCRRCFLTLSDAEQRRGAVEHDECL